MSSCKIPFAVTSLWETSLFVNVTGNKMKERHGCQSFIITITPTFRMLVKRRCCPTELITICVFDSTSVRVPGKVGAMTARWVCQASFRIKSKCSIWEHLTGLWLCCFLILMIVCCFQEGLRNTDFSTSLTVFGLKPRSGNGQVLVWRLLLCYWAIC